MSLVDAHTHLELLALRKVPFDSLSSVEELLSYLRNIREDFILAWGWDEKKLGRAPLREDLDSVDVPVLLLRMDAHVGVANSKLIEDMGLEEKGEFFDPDRGFLYETLLWGVVEKMKPKGRKMRDTLLKATQYAFKMGVIEVHDYVDSEVAGLYRELDTELPIRIVLMPYYENYMDVVQLFEGRAFKSLRLGWVKVFVDGSVGARTAYLSEPYEDKKGWRGNLLRGKEELVRIIGELEERRLRVSLHAVGDGAVEECLRAFEEVKPTLKYHRIEHAVLMSREQALRARDLNLLICVQPNFKPFFRETYLKALGKKRYRECVPISMLDSLGVDMVFGSDMMPFEPHYGLDYAKKILGEEKAKYYYGGWRKEGRYV
ncbi:hypothetical protein BCF55_1294 [Hydrogenivirga caldilitoris]|uniref:Amidohydrolase 3 domain-containing protein n=1 Tax=Hydrogenivirga caldilitoris TaxID=246264 RepID=A0A497XPX5_9AQUI|nr:amidohydrolase family protein [Hydrogenivirga caldilitoris]RLJ71005.1 hypothetical protein BCF55_1294 [Hydrogenivirga caldilitoris]